jgi:hypothetical protein
MALLDMDEFTWTNSYDTFKVGRESTESTTFNFSLNGPWGERSVYSTALDYKIVARFGGNGVTSFVSGCLMRSNRQTGYFGAIFQALGYNTTQFKVEYNEEGSLILFNGSTVIARAECDYQSRVRLERWNWYEVKATMHDSTGSVAFYVNGQLILNATNVDNVASAVGSEVSLVLWGGESAMYMQTTGLYTMDQTGLTNNDVVGAWTVETINPDGDGNRNDFAPDSGLTNYTQVDETVSDGDTSYVESTTVDDDELYTYTALSNSFTAINGVQVNALVKKTAPGDRLIRMLARSSASENESAADGVPIDYARSSAIFPTDPNGGGAWTEASVNAAEFGLTIES